MIEYEDLADELRALSNPLRIAVLACIADGEETPTGVLRALLERRNGLSLSLVAYHVEKLRQARLVVLTRTERVGNWDRYYYEPSERGRGLLVALGVRP